MSPVVSPPVVLRLWRWLRHVVPLRRGGGVTELTFRNAPRPAATGTFLVHEARPDGRAHAQRYALRAAVATLLLGYVRPVGG